MSVVAISEKMLQEQVLRVARLAGWLVYHTHDSRRSAAGFPDLTLVRGGDLLFVELKTETGRLSEAQQTWRDALQVVQAAVDDQAVCALGRAAAGGPCVEWHCWRPSDFDEMTARLTRPMRRSSS